jgi:formylmethanofuran dehydrogenase subunit E-like metal-binding protein
VVKWDWKVVFPQLQGQWEGNLEVAFRLLPRAEWVKQLLVVYWELVDKMANQVYLEVMGKVLPLQREKLEVVQDNQVVEKLGL